jgi:hypothetical protein
MKLVVLTLAILGLGTSTAEAVGPKLTAPTPGLRIVQLRQFITHDNFILTHQYQDRVVNHFGGWQQIARVRLATQEILDARVHVRWAKRMLARYWSMLGNIGNWNCIHRFEGSWQDSGDPYWGGLQMDTQFQGHYGRDMIRAYGGYANRWHPYDQIIVAQRAYNAGRGYGPWPNTAAYCGLL